MNKVNALSKGVLAGIPKSSLGVREDFTEEVTFELGLYRSAREKLQAIPNRIYNVTHSTEHKKSSTCLAALSSLVAYCVEFLGLDDQN